MSDILRANKGAKIKVQTSVSKRRVNLADSNTITEQMLRDSSVTTNKIADANVTTNKIANANVTAAKLAADVPQSLNYDLYHNALINGGIEFSQRGTYSATAEAVNSQYHVDRWKEYFGGGSTGCVLTRNTLISSDLPFPSSLYSWKVAANNTTGAGQIFSSQFVEDYGKLKGKTVTFSTIVKSNNSNTRLFIYDGVTYTVGDAHSAGSGNWQLLTLTKTMSSSATQLQCSISITNASASNVAITSGDYYEFSAAVLNVGSFYLPYQPRSLQQELILCQRYYEKSYAAGTTPGSAGNVGAFLMLNAASGTGNIGGTVYFKVQKRTNGFTVYAWDTASNAGKCYKGGDNKAVTLALYAEGSFFVRSNDATNTGEFNVNWVCDNEI